MHDIDGLEGNEPELEDLILSLDNSPDKIRIDISAKKN